MTKKLIIIVLLTSLVLSCSVYKTMVNISRLKFKLSGVSDFHLNGMDISDKGTLKDFGAVQIFQLTGAIAKGEVPVSFNVIVEAKNPNDGNGGFPPTDITIKRFPWKLFINGKETISGSIDKPVEVPGVGKTNLIRFHAKLNLLKFIRTNGLGEVINLVLKLGGKKSDPTSLKIVAEPVLETPLGEMTYPEPVTIVSENYN